MAYVHRNYHSTAKKWHGQRQHPYLRNSAPQRNLDFRCKKTVSVYQHPYWKEAVICATVANKLSLEIQQWKQNNAKFREWYSRYEILQNAHRNVTKQLSTYCESLSSAPISLKTKLLQLKTGGSYANSAQLREDCMKWKNAAELQIAKKRRHYELLRRKQFISLMRPPVKK